MISRPISQFLSIIIITIALSSLLFACSHVPSRHSTPVANTPDHSHHSMDLGLADADYDLRFIDAMVIHHEGAVTMAQDLQQKSQRPELQQLAKAILKAQPQEISQMQQWRKTWYPKAPSAPMAWHTEMKQMMAMTPEQVKAMRMNMDLGKADADYDQRFLKAMIPHHEAAVTMAQDLAAKTKRPELQKLAQAIVTSQQAEIDQMKQWQKDWKRP